MNNEKYGSMKWGEEYGFSRSIRKVSRKRAYNRYKKDLILPAIDQIIDDLRDPLQLTEGGEIEDKAITNDAIANWKALKFLVENA